MTVRRIREDDAGTFLDLLTSLDSETSFMTYEPDERPSSVERQRGEMEGGIHPSACFANDPG